jgi:hypothetical protein
MLKSSERAILFPALSVLLLSLALQTSSQSQSRLVSTEDLARQAEVVAVGKVTALRSEWNEAHTMIRTRVTLSVDEYVKGGISAPTFTLYAPGGEVGGVGELYSDMATFRQDENVVVFAQKDKQGRYRISDGFQGKMTIVKDQITGKLMVAGGKTLDELTSDVKRSLQLQQKN